MSYVTQTSGYDLLNITTQKTQFGLTLTKCAEITGRPRSMLQKGFTYRTQWPFLHVPPRFEEFHKGWILRETSLHLVWPNTLDDPRIHVLVKARFKRMPVNLEKPHSEPQGSTL